MTIVVEGFPITPDVRLRKAAQHEGIHYEVSNHGRSTANFVGGEFEMTPSGGTWCYYVTVSEAQLTPELFAEFWLSAKLSQHASGWPRVSYDYYDTRFANADWHGGVTYYEKLGGLDGAQRYVKIGCDFAHLWDEGGEFNLEIVESEAIETVTQLLAMYPFKRRCPYFGTYHDVADMVPHPKNGALYSAEGITKMLAEK